MNNNELIISNNLITYQPIENEIINAYYNFTYLEYLNSILNDYELKYIYKIVKDILLNNLPNPNFPILEKPNGFLIEFTNIPEDYLGNWLNRINKIIEVKSISLYFNIPLGSLSISRAKNFNFSYYKERNFKDFIIFLLENHYNQEKINEFLKMQNYGLYSQNEECIKLSYKLIKNLKISQKYFNFLKIASTLYNLSLALLPNEILNCKNVLTLEQYNKILNAPNTGMALGKNLNCPKESLILLENFNKEIKCFSTSLTLNLDAETLKNVSQILTISNLFTSLSSRKAYRNPLNKEEILNVIEEKYYNHFTDKIKISLLKFI